MRSNNILAAAAMTAGLSCFPGQSSADVIWDWSFEGETGTFMTDGAAPGGVAPPGTYDLLDFSVTSSAAGEPIGSLSGGQYIASGFDTGLPYSFTWDGSAVTAWLKTGINTFDWWVFDTASEPNLYYFFGWAPPNTNDPTSAAVYDTATVAVVSTGTVTVSVPGVVPEPATWTMMLLGFCALGAALRTRRKPAFAA